MKAVFKITQAQLEKYKSGLKLGGANELEQLNELFNEASKEVYNTYAVNSVYNANDIEVKFIANDKNLNVFVTDDEMKTRQSQLNNHSLQSIANTLKGKVVATEQKHWEEHTKELEEQKAWEQKKEILDEKKTSKDARLKAKISESKDNQLKQDQGIQKLEQKVQEIQKAQQKIIIKKSWVDKYKKARIESFFEEDAPKNVNSTQSNLFDGDKDFMSLYDTVCKDKHNSIAINSIRNNNSQNFEVEYKNNQGFSVKQNRDTANILERIKNAIIANNRFIPQKNFGNDDNHEQPIKQPQLSVELQNRLELEECIRENQPQQKETLDRLMHNIKHPDNIITKNGESGQQNIQVILPNSLASIANNGSVKKIESNKETKEKVNENDIKVKRQRKSLFADVVGAGKRAYQNVAKTYKTVIDNLPDGDYSQVDTTNKKLTNNSPKVVANNKKSEIKSELKVVGKDSNKQTTIKNDAKIINISIEENPVNTAVTSNDKVVSNSKTNASLWGKVEKSYDNLSNNLGSIIVGGVIDGVIDGVEYIFKKAKDNNINIFKRSPATHKLKGENKTSGNNEEINKIIKKLTAAFLYGKSDGAFGYDGELAKRVYGTWFAGSQDRKKKHGEMISDFAKKYVVLNQQEEKIKFINNYFKNSQNSQDADAVKVALELAQNSLQPKAEGSEKNELVDIKKVSTNIVGTKNNTELKIVFEENQVETKKKTDGITPDNNENKKTAVTFTPKTQVIFSDTKNEKSVVSSVIENNNTNVVPVNKEEEKKIILENNNNINNSTSPSTGTNVKPEEKKDEVMVVEEVDNKNSKANETTFKSICEAQCGAYYKSKNTVPPKLTFKIIEQGDKRFYIISGADSAALLEIVKSALNDKLLNGRFSLVQDDKVKSEMIEVSSKITDKTKDGETITSNSGVKYTNVASSSPKLLFDKLSLFSKPSLVTPVTQKENGVHSGVVERTSVTSTKEEKKEENGLSSGDAKQMVSSGNKK